MSTARTLGRKARASRRSPAPAIGGEVSQYTGRFLLLFGDRLSTSEMVESLESKAGLRVAASSDFEGRTMTSPADTEFAMVFENLGIAVVDAPREQLGHVSVASAGSLLVPERFIYVAGSLQVTREYLEGFRDATVRRLLGEDDARLAVRSNPSVRASLAAASAVTWNLERSGVAASSRTGRNVKLAVLDTGIDLDHPDFANRDIKTKSFVPDGSITDIHGHGTHCAGTAAGLAVPVSNGPRYGAASDCELLIGKVLGDNGKGDESWLLNGIEWAINEGARIVSISIETPFKADEPALPQYETAGGRALDQGTLLIAAAGNHSSRPFLTRPVASPASASTIMSVAALNPDDTIAAFSCTSSAAARIDVSAPGVAIESSAPTPRTRRVDSGTSMATPLVAGIAALYCQADPSLQGQALWDTLLRTARPVSASADDAGVGGVSAPS